MERKVLKEIKAFDREIKTIIDKTLPRPTTYPNLTEIQIINFLLRNQDKKICQNDIVEELKLKKSSVAERLNIMEEKGILKRITDEDDNRKRLIFLSQESKDKRNEFIGKLDAIESKVTKGIPKEKMNVFFEVLDIMEGNLRKGKV